VAELQQIVGLDVENIKQTILSLNVEGQKI